MVTHMNKYKQTQTALLGALTQLFEDRELAYISTTNFAYSHLTDKGREYILNTIDALFPSLAQGYALELQEKAEELFIDKLTKS